MNKYTRKILIGLIFIVFLLDWAALDDITTGKEHSFMEEHLILAVSIPAILVVIYLMYRNKRLKNK